MIEFPQEASKAHAGARMAKATLTLRNGTTVAIEGDVGEVQRLLEVYDHPTRPRERETPAPKGARVSRRVHTREQGALRSQPHEIANATKDCPEAAAIEKHILDGRNQLNRVLLPLYVVSEHLDGGYALTMSEISQVTRDLGALVKPPNVAKVMRTVGGRFVMAEGGRGPGERRFRISRRGIDHVKTVLRGEPEQAPKRAPK